LFAFGGNEEEEKINVKDILLLHTAGHVHKTFNQ
jgi:hypothetical protein